MWASWCNAKMSLSACFYSIIIIIIIYLSCSWATCWPVPVSRTQKSPQRSTMIPSASRTVVVSLPWVIYFEAFYLHAVSSFSCIPVIFPKLVLFLTLLQFVNLFCNLSQVYPAVLLMYFISAAVILLASLALTVQVSLPYNKTGRASLLCSFIVVFLRGFCGLNTLLKIPEIFENLFNLYYACVCACVRGKRRENLPHNYFSWIGYLQLTKWKLWRYWRKVRN